MKNIPEPQAAPEGRFAVVFDGAAVESFEVFYRREMPALISFSAVLSGWPYAEDVAQDAMLAAYRRWDMVGADDVPADWLRRVCANRSASRLRRRAVKAKSILSLGMRRGARPPVADEDEKFWTEVRQLPRPQTQAIALHYIYDLGVRDIADTLRCAEGTVETHLSRGLAALGRQLDRAHAGQVTIIEELGRTAATEARRAATRVVDTNLLLQRLHRLRRRRGGGSVLGALAIAAAVVATGVLANRRDAGELQNRPESTSPPTSATRSSGPAGLCGDPEVRCLGGNKYRFVDLPAPITVALPANFQRMLSVTPGGITGYRRDISTAGVSVTENAVPARYGPAAWTRDPAAGTTAASMARWLWRRPFLVHTTLTRTTVAGLPAWHVSGDLRRGAALPAPKAGGNVAPTFGRVYIDNAGYRADLTGQYTLLDVPRAGVTVIWSWTLNRSDQTVVGNQAFIDGLSFD